MKIRAAKVKRNTGYVDFNDFLNKEFSKDKEVFIPDLELSCNDCDSVEDFANHRDSTLSFLVKFKADQLSDPKAVSQGASGFNLPDSLNYVSDSSRPSIFRSIQLNHFNLVFSNASDLVQVAEDIFEDLNSHPHFAASDVDSYLETVYSRSDWGGFASNPNKTKWKKHIGNVLKRRLHRDYGKVDNQKEIVNSLGIDAAGFKNLIADILKYTSFSENETALLKANYVI